MLTNAVITLPEASELKGSAISAATALVERLEEVIGNLETALVRQRAENARLRLVESAAVSALADLDALLAESEPLDVTQTSIGNQG